jgi:hypothetical protein
MFGRLLNVAHGRLPQYEYRVGLLTSGLYCFGEETAGQPIKVTYRQLLAARSRDKL